MKKITNKKIFNEELLNLVVILIIIVIVISPIIIKVPFIKSSFSWFLKDLGSLKSDYLSIFQGVIGTFLAITGALWTQRKIDQSKEKQQIKVIANSVLYMFERNLAVLRKIYIANKIDELFCVSENYLTGEMFLLNKDDGSILNSVKKDIYEAKHELEYSFMNTNFINYKKPLNDIGYNYLNQILKEKIEIKELDFLVNQDLGEKIFILDNFTENNNESKTIFRVLRDFNDICFGISCNLDLIKDKEKKVKLSEEIFRKDAYINEEVLKEIKELKDTKKELLTSQEKAKENWYKIKDQRKAWEIEKLAILDTIRMLEEESRDKFSRLILSIHIIDSLDLQVNNLISDIIAYTKECDENKSEYEIYIDIKKIIEDHLKDSYISDEKILCFNNELDEKYSKVFIQSISQIRYSQLQIYELKNKLKENQYFDEKNNEHIYCIEAEKLLKNINNGFIDDLLTTDNELIDREKFLSKYNKNKSYYEAIKLKKGYHEWKCYIESKNLDINIKTCNEYILRTYCEKLYQNSDLGEYGLEQLIQPKKSLTEKYYKVWNLLLTID